MGLLIDSLSDYERVSDPCFICNVGTMSLKIVCRVPLIGWSAAADSDIFPGRVGFVSVVSFGVVAGTTRVAVRAVWGFVCVGFSVGEYRATGFPTVRRITLWVFGLCVVIVDMICGWVSMEAKTQAFGEAKTQAFGYDYL